MTNKKLLNGTAVAIAILLILVGAGIGLATEGENPNSSAKATAQIAELDVFSACATQGDEVDWHGTGPVDILEQTIKTANGKDLFIDVSLLSGLYTETNVKSKGGQKDTSGAAAGVLLAVFVDGEMVYPYYPVVFNARIQELSATLQGIITDMEEVDGVWTFTTEFEEIGLWIATMSTNSFNFIVPDLESGMHTVTVKAACVSAAWSQNGNAGAMAAIGLGSVTIEEVRMIQGEDAVPEY